MNRILGLIFFITGIFLFLTGQWIAFEMYANSKLGKINENVSQFIQNLYMDNTFIILSNPEENVFVFRTADGKVITTGNTIEPSDMEDYISTSFSVEGHTIYIYTRRVSFSDYMLVLIEKPFALGSSISGVVFLLIGLFLLLKETPVKATDSEYKERLAKHLKALRISLAMSKIIPEDSISEARKILDDIIKITEVK